MTNPFRRISSRQVYDSHTFRLCEHIVAHPNGSESPFPVIEMRRGSSVLAIDDTEHVYLVREFKYAIDRPSLEVISGGADDGEEPAHAATRELEEEAGLLAREWIACGSIDPYTTMVTGPVFSSSLPA